MLSVLLIGLLVLFLVRLVGLLLRKSHYSRKKKCKCMLILLYGLVACSLNKSQLSSIDFVINRLFMKLFSTSDMVSDVVRITPVSSYQVLLRLDVLINFWIN